MLLPIALLLTLAAPAAAARAPKAEDAAERFYAAYLAVHPPGLPEGDGLKKLEPFLSRKLRDLIDAALVEQERFEKAHPGDKPPFVDGDYFSSNFEGISSFRVGKAEARGNGYRVEMHLTYAEGEGADAQRVEWKDVLVLVEEDGKLLVDDVDLQGDWPFATHGRLSEILAERER